MPRDDDAVLQGIAERLTAEDPELAARLRAFRAGRQGGRPPRRSRPAGATWVLVLAAVLALPVVVQASPPWAW